MQERLAELKTEEREVEAQLTWKVLVEEPPLLNGAAPSAEQPKLLQWPQPSGQAAKKPEDEEEEQQQEEEEEELTPTNEPQELRVTGEQPVEQSAELSVSAKELHVEPVEDPFTSIMSTASTRTAAWPQTNTVRHYVTLKHAGHPCGINSKTFSLWCFQEGSSPALEWEVKGVEMNQQTSTTKVSIINGRLIVNR